MNWFPTTHTGQWLSWIFATQERKKERKKKKEGIGTRTSRFTICMCSAWRTTCTHSAVLTSAKGQHYDRALRSLVVRETWLLPSQDLLARRCHSTNKDFSSTCDPQAGQRGQQQPRTHLWRVAAEAWKMEGPTWLMGSLPPPHSSD